MGINPRLTNCQVSTLSLSYQHTPSPVIHSVSVGWPTSVNNTAQTGTRRQLDHLVIDSEQSSAEWCSACSSCTPASAADVTIRMTY